MKKSLLIVFLIIIVFSDSYANAGTPLMWASLFHLLFGNFVIGAVETYLLQKELLIYKNIYVFIIIVIANYVSMFVGSILTSNITNYLGFDSFNPTNSSYLWESIILYLSLTVASFIIEYPFFYWVLKKKNYFYAFKITLKINLITALLVFIYYLFFSNLISNLV